MEKCPIVISAFCRPEMTIDCILRILRVFPDREIYVSQDGAIQSYFFDSHAMLRSQLRNLLKANPRLNLFLWDVNSGITNHFIRAFSRVFENHRELIFIEEDMVLDQSAASFLDRICKDVGPSHRTAYVTSEHPELSPVFEYRETFFPEQWGISINNEFFNLVREQLDFRIVERNRVRQIFDSLQLGPLLREAATDFWVQLLKAEINSPHGWDATMQYTLWREQFRSKVSLVNSIIDIGGDLSSGAVTARSTIELDLIQSHKFKELPKFFQVCEHCERLDMKRRNINVVSQLRKRSQVRTRIMNAIQSFRYR